MKNCKFNFNTLNEYVLYHKGLAEKLGIEMAVYLTAIINYDDIFREDDFERVAEIIKQRTGMSTQLQHDIYKFFTEQDNILIIENGEVIVNYDNDLFTTKSTDCKIDKPVDAQIVTPKKSNRTKKIDLFREKLPADILRTEIENGNDDKIIAAKYDIEPYYYVTTLRKEYGIEKPKKKTNQEAKLEGMRNHAINRIHTKNEELINAYTVWIDEVLNKFGYINNLLVDEAQKLIDEFTDKDLDKALDIIKIAATNGWKDMQYAINKFKSCQFSCTSKENIIQYKPMTNDIKSDTITKLNNGELKVY